MRATAITLSHYLSTYTHSELEIGNHHQNITHSPEQQRIKFNPYTFVAEDAGSAYIRVESKNEHGLSDFAALRIQTELNPHSEFLVAIDPGHYTQQPVILYAFCEVYFSQYPILPFFLWP